MSSSKTDILVVGGGLAGCATAYYLARAGAEVTVIERDELNMQASGANAGSFHAQIPHITFLEEGEAWARNFAPVVEMLIEAITLWRGLEAELDADLEVRIGGGILIADRPEQMRDIERRMSLERAHGLDDPRPDQGRAAAARAVRLRPGGRRLLLPDRRQGQSAEGHRGLRQARAGGRRRLPSLHRAAGARSGRWRLHRHHQQRHDPRAAGGELRGRQPAARSRACWASRSRCRASRSRST